MNATLADDALLKKSAEQGAKLVARHDGDRMLHRARITIAKLDFFYGRTQALEQVRLTVPEYQVTSLIGPSGCGKSTLLGVMNRIYGTYPGQAAVGCPDLVIDPPRRPEPQRRSKQSRPS